MSIQFKPDKDHEAYYDNWANGIRDNFKNRKYVWAKDFEKQMINQDKEWAKEGEP